MHTSTLFDRAMFISFLLCISGVFFFAGEGPTLYHHFGLKNPQFLSLCSMVSMVFLLIILLNIIAFIEKQWLKKVRKNVHSS
jgi:hypothetical protein